mmetsp:Transcript_20351/g.28607  ORF Transcript_20351/g.28607 Transcript_20351/m.28607 type:complete len:123 (+) Transcript_20351:6105-6473(+)
MIMQGTDGFSRGDTSEGVMQGVNMLEYVPLHLSCLERSPTLKKWICSWLKSGNGENKVTFLEPEGWFQEGHNIVGFERNLDQINLPRYKHETFVWTPAPSSVGVAVEQLRRIIKWLTVLFRE